MVATRSQDGDLKGKGVNTEDPKEELEEFRAETNQRFDMIMETLSKLRVAQESDDRSTLERETSPLTKTKGVGSGSLSKIRDDRRSEGEGQGRTDSHRPYNHLTRMGKIEFPRFDGSDLKGWLFKAEEFFGLDYTPPEMKVRMASIHFEGFAAKWHQNFIESDLGMSVRFDWRSYVHFMKDMFEEEDDDPMAELKNLREKDGIRDYHQKFETVRTRLRLPEDYLVSVYLAGLRTDTRMHVKMFRPETVRDCYYLGKTYEKAHPKQAVSSGWSHKGNVSVGFSKNQKEKVAEQAKENIKPVFQKRLSQQEISDRRSKGLCYLCDEKFTPEHYAAAHKKTQLYFMEVEAEDEWVVDTEGQSAEEEPDLDNTEPMPRISVNAVSGIYK